MQKAVEAYRIANFLYNRLTDGGECFGLKRQPHFTLCTPGSFWVLSTVRGCSDTKVIARLRGIGKLEIEIG